MEIQTIIREGKLSPEQEKTYVHLPFEMPEGAVRLEVSFHYSDRIGSDPRLSGGNTIDLGLFDERGMDFLEAGFRGWSGSERDQFFISETEATPGYLEGPLHPGEWKILLGLYKIAPNGCDFRVVISIKTETSLDKLRYTKEGDFSPQKMDLPSSPPPAIRAPWICGELHSHTWHSDGAFSPAELVEMARRCGLDFLGISDHNTTSAQHELETMRDPGLVLVRGVEVTTFHGHFNVWGIPDWIDFRVGSAQQMEAAIGRANALGAVTSCAHPKPLGPDWDYPEASGYHCVEVWNGPWSGLNEMSLEFWLKLLVAGERVVAVGGSDFHRAGEYAGGQERQPGIPACWVYLENLADGASPAEIRAEHILQAVRQGRVSLSDAPDGPLLELLGQDALRGKVLPGGMIEFAPGKAPEFNVRCQGGKGGILRILDQDTELLVQEIDREDITATCHAQAGKSLYVRAEIRGKDAADDGRMRALTNPIYLSW